MDILVCGIENQSCSTCKAMEPVGAIAASLTSAQAPSAASGTLKGVCTRRPRKPVTSGGSRCVGVSYYGQLTPY